MIPGPIHVYKCPNCGNFIKNNSLMSGNTFRSKIYSDGKQISPMLPEYPNFNKCIKCQHLFWLNQTEVEGTYHSDEGQKQEWVDAEFAKFPSIDDYLEAIDLNMAPTRDAEIDFRRRILWAFNDRRRNTKELFNDKADEAKWGSNIDRMVDILESDNMNEKILLAELHRYKGEFDKCMELINSLPSPDMDWLKDAFEKECQAKNNMVFGFN